MKQLAALLLVVIPLMVSGQDNYMSLGIGASFPSGKFSKTNDIRSNGFALNDFHGEYHGVYFINKNLGVGGSIKTMSNSINESKFKNIFLQELPPEFSQDSVESVTIDAWKQIALLVGPHFTVPLEKFNIDLYTLVGLNFITTPAQQIIAVNDDYKFNSRLSTQNVSFGVDFGMTFRYHLSEMYSLGLNAGYFISQAKGQSTREIINTEQGIHDVQKSDYKVPVQSFNISIGIVYRM